MPKLVAGWVLGTHVLFVRVQVSLLVIKYFFVDYKIWYFLSFNFTSLAKLVKQVPSKQKFIGSSPIRCLN